MFCILPGASINHTSKLWPPSLNTSDPIRCGGSGATAAYIRSDVGGSLMPWHLVAVLFLVHLPLVLVRVASWKKGQIIGLVVAFFDAITTTQAYLSTKLNPAKVMVWTPILLVIDVGAVLQVFILVVEKYGARFPILRYIMNEPPSEQEDEGFLNPLLRRKNWGSRSKTTQNIPWAELLIATIALFLFFGTIALQIVGLIAAIRARSVENLTVPWCSPIFTVFSFAVQDTNCNLYAVKQNRNGGIACINLPATLQHRWSIATEVIVALSLVLQFIDFCILLCVNSKFKKLQQAKMKRPWFTMFFGLGVLLTVLILSILQANMLPPGLSKDVLVANEAETEFLCRGTLTPPGLRGTNIGWWDGLMQSWGCAWYGCS